MGETEDVLTHPVWPIDHFCFSFYWASLVIYRNHRAQQYG